MKKVLITGAGGYIGSHIFNDLSAKGFDVTGIDRVTGESKSKGILKADITEPKTFDGSYREMDVLVHCAALVHGKSRDLSRNNYFKINVEGMKNILSFLDKGKLEHIVFLSTVSVYGDSANAWADIPKLLPGDFYGESKLAAEKYLEEFREKYDIPYTVLRPVPVYGRDFFLNINKRIYLPKKAAFYKIGPGSQRISLCSVGNIVDTVHSCLLDKAFVNRTFIMKDRDDYTINEVIDTFNTLYHRGKKPVIRLPKVLCETLLKGMRAVLPGRGASLLYQFRKIAGDSVYPETAFPSGGKGLRWDLKTTLAVPGERE